MDWLTESLLSFNALLRELIVGSSNLVSVELHIKIYTSTKGFPKDICSDSPRFTSILHDFFVVCRRNPLPYQPKFD